MCKKSALAVLFLCATAISAVAQVPVKQSGTSITPGQVPWWITSGVIGGGVSSADSPVTSFGVTNNGGNAICANSDRITAAGRNTLCWSTQTSGPATITLQNYGTATPQALEFVVNGTVYNIASIVPPSAIAPNTYLGNNTPATIAPVAVPQPIFYANAYTTVQAAVDAAKAAKSGIVFFPCGTYSLGSGSIGLNLDDSNVIRLTSSDGVNGGADQCAKLLYSGTGTMISGRSNFGLEIDHLYLVASNTAAKVIDLSHSGSAVDGTGNIHDNSIFTNSSNSNNVGIDIDQTESVVIEHNTLSIADGTAIRGVTIAGHYVVKCTIAKNIFNTQNAIGIKGPGDGCSVKDNTVEAPITSFIATGPAGTCSTLVLSSNWMGDDSTGVTFVNSNCLSLVSTGNVFGSSSTATGIRQSNSTGVVASIGDTFSGSVGVNIGTGNFLTLIPSGIGSSVTTLVSGTPSTNSSGAMAIYGPVSIGTTSDGGPLTVASSGNGTGTSGIQVVASDYVTNGGALRFNKDNGINGDAHLFAFDNSQVDNLKIQELGGPTTFGGQIISTFGTPSIASGACGTGANGTISGTNASGAITIGASATTACTISFSATLTAAPKACLIFPGNAAAAATGTTVASVTAPSTTQWGIGGSALANTVYRYICL